jgi:L-alanine-DL-glutamate epimerase-like enolase superfamily enzyme
MSLFDERLADLALTIDDYELERREVAVSSGFDRVTTTIHLRGDGTDGLGEDVSYDAVDHDLLQQAGPILPLAGEWTIGSFCDHLAALELWPAPAQREASVLYRLWAYESAALDLALRQARLPLHRAIGREPAAVTFVVSRRLGEPSTTEPIHRLLAAYPTLRFKLDPTNDWTAALIDELAATSAVDSIDFKGHYSGSVVDVEPDPELYRLVMGCFPDAWLEDPHVELYPLVESERRRVSWDAPIHSVADIEALPWQPAMVNVKPSRLGGLRSLLAAYEHCEANGIGMYGGGQFELGVGRGQIQYMASLFHPHGPNDVAPTGYNLDFPPDGLPASPLPVAVEPIGFRWS